MRIPPRRSTILFSFLLILGALAVGCAGPAAKEARFLRRGKAQLESGDYSRAALEFQNAAAAAPTDAEPYYQIARVYMSQHQPRQAYAALQRATILNPSHAEAQLWLAAMMTSSSEIDVLEEAEARAKRVLAKSPDYPQALDTLAAAEVRLGKLESASRHLEEAVAKAPQSEGAALNLARLRASQGDLASAEKALRKLATDSPKSASAALLLANFYVGSGRKAEGEAEVRRALSLGSVNPYAFLLLASLETNAGHPEAAEQTYRRLSALPAREYKTAYAIHLFREGKRSQAVTELERLVKQSPENREYRNLLVSAYVEQGRYGSAEMIVVAALKRNPKNIDALLQRVDLSFRVGKIAAAEEDARTVLHLEPGSAMAHYAIARVSGARGESAIQRQELGEAVRLAPDFLAARLELASLLRTANSSAAALALLDQAPDLQKSSVAYIAARNWVLLTMGRIDEASRVLKLALSSVRAPELVYQDALVKISGRNYSEARQSLEEVLRVYPESASSLNALAQSYAASGQMPKAIEALRERISASSQSPPLHNLLGEWLARAGRSAESREAFANAVRVAPDYVPAAVALAEIDVEAGNTENARKTVIPVLTRHPENIPARLLLAQAEDIAGNHAAALAQYRRVTEEDPRNVVALNNLAYALIGNNPDEALKLGQNALEIAPDEPAVLDTFGWICFRKGLYRNAVRYLKRAVDKQATPRREYHLGMAYAKVGEARLSQQYLSTALVKDPNLKGTEIDLAK